MNKIIFVALICATIVALVVVTRDDPVQVVIETKKSASGDVLPVACKLQCASSEDVSGEEYSNADP